MKAKHYLAYLLAATLLCGLTGCSGAADSDSETAAETSAAETAENTEAISKEEGQEITQAETIAFEEAMDAEPGQAYLAIVDKQWWIQYWGSSTDDGHMLAYDAGITDITGNGQYTVSVTADTNGFRYDTTTDPNGKCTPGGLSFLAVMIKDGETLYPGAVITVDSILVDGKEITMSAKNYTSSDDGIETRTNLYNGYIDAPAEDARSTEGALYDADGNALDICADYSPQVVSPDDFSTWTTVEVNFTISGIGEDGTAAGEETSALEEETAPEEESTSASAESSAE